ncbi:MFS transporter [Sphingomonas sp.]|uniref:MFS transporter n=1 Tax=Sphingomonas sp. TaxID=28214 RepID=UPI000DB61C42|nr:MFS transporter [Sphingomonas sp.]PZU09712.1 MAG: MFS transporter [Sphingomonas sp.]
MTGETRADPLATAYRRITLRFVPFLFLCYIFNYLDRVNVGFAKLEMLGAIGMSETAYGFGAGIFFLGYIACGVPSNLLAERVGARRWLACLMIVWGAISAAMLFVRTPIAFYILRFAMGAAEAGFFPGIVLFLTRWFPASRRGRVMALFMSAIPLSGVLGGPLSGWILARFGAGQGGLEAWQWMFLIEAIPTILLGLAMLRLLDEGGDRASWLDPAERIAVAQALAAEAHPRTMPEAGRLAPIWGNPVLWRLGAIYFCIQSGVYAINFWLPSIIAQSGQSDPMLIGWLSAIPYLAAALFMIAIGRSADRRAERRWHLAGPMLLGAVGLGLSALMATTPLWSLLGLTLAAMGALTALPMFWPLSDRHLAAAGAAAGIAFVNSLGQMAGFLSPYAVGWIKDASGSTTIALAMLSAMLAIGSLLTLRFRR